MKQVNIYTDGACSGNQNEENVGGWGCILEYGPHTKELCGGEINTTNNRMELTALIAGLSALKEKGLDIFVYADSSYLVNCFKNKWYAKWQKNGWLNSAKQPVENKELWEKLIELMQGQSLSFRLVKGHVNTNWRKERLSPIYDKFKEHNGSGFSYEDFIYITEKNNRADELANVFIVEHAKAEE